MDRVEKANELMKRAEKLGFLLGFRSGVIVAVKQTESGDPEREDAMLGELLKYLPEIRSKEHGEGTLIGAGDDGTLTISIGQEVRTRHEEEVRRCQMSITSKAQRLLVLDVAQASSTLSPNDEPTSDLSRKRIFELFRRSPGKD